MYAKLTILRDDLEAAEEAAILSRLVCSSNCISLHASRMCCCCSCCTLAASPCACCVSFRCCCCCSALCPKGHQVRFLVSLRGHGVGVGDELGVSLARVLNSPVGSEPSSACICCCFVLRRRMVAERRSGTLGCGMRVGAGREANCVVVGDMLLLSVPLPGVSAAIVVVHCSCCCCDSSSPCTDVDDVSSGNNDVMAGVAVAVPAVAVVILLLLLFLAESKMQIIAIVCCCLFVFCTFENEAIFPIYFSFFFRTECTS